MKATSLVYKVEKTVNNKVVIVKVRLNDECKNGHQDFAITGDIYEAGKPRVDKYHLTGGCIHDEILKYFPELKIFVNLHLADFNGVPMHAVANGFYHMVNGFSNCQPADANFKNLFCEYYRVNGETFDALKEARTKIHYYLVLLNSGTLDKWKEEAKGAIKLLEELTGQEFENNSTRSQLDAPTQKEIQKIQELTKKGYFEPEQVEKREKQKGLNILADKIKDVEKEISNRKNEIKTLKAVFDVGGLKALENCIFYNHTSELAFNWRSCDKLSDEDIKNIKDKIKLPKGVSIK